MFTTAMLALLVAASGSNGDRPTTIRVTNRGPAIVNVSLQWRHDRTARYQVGIIRPNSTVVLEVPRGLEGATGMRILAEPVDNKDFALRPMSFKATQHAYHSRTLTIRTGRLAQLTVGGRLANSTLAMR